jgi:hypothetical protein
MTLPSETEPARALEFWGWAEEAGCRGSGPSRCHAAALYKVKGAASRKTRRPTKGVQPIPRTGLTLKAPPRFNVPALSVQGLNTRLKGVQGAYRLDSANTECRTAPAWAIPTTAGDPPSKFFRQDVSTRQTSHSLRLSSIESVMSTLVEFPQNYLARRSDGGGEEAIRQPQREVQVLGRECFHGRLLALDSDLGAP